MLAGISGIDNVKLLKFAARHPPSLVVDCANAADPHKLYPGVTLEQLSKVYVVELELLYKFRDVLLRVPSIMRKIGGDYVVVTTSNHLFHYQNEKENHDILEHAWQILRFLSRRYKIIAGVAPEHMGYAKRYCDKLWATHYQARG